MSVRIYNGWIISSEGGFITLKRFDAVKHTPWGDLWHWAYRLKECKQFCDDRDAGREIKRLYLKPLYR